MSKIYEALQRLEWERAEYHAGKQEKRASGATRLAAPGEWWTGALVGCLLGFGMGIVAVLVTSDRPRLAPPELPAVASALPPAVVQALPLAVTPSQPSAGERPTPPIVAEAPPIEPDPVATVPDATPFAIQVGTFRNRENAARLAAHFGAAAYRVTIEPSASDDTLWVVRIGDYPDREQAEAARAGLKQQGMSGLLVSRKLEPDVDGASRHVRASEGD